MGESIRLIAALAFGLFGATTGAHAETPKCGLQLFASVDMLNNNSGSILIPVTLDGEQTAMIIDTGAFWSGAALSVVPGLKTTNSSIGAVGAGGGVTHQVVRVPEIRIGSIVLNNIEFMLLPGNFTTDPRIGGNIGANILRAFDVEIDPAARKVNFLSKDHCKGQVIHWPHSDLIDIPLHVGEDGILTIPVQLDGKELRAEIDTGASATDLRLDVAKAQFGLVPDSPGMEKAGTSRTIDGANLAQYEHRFETLAIQDVTFKNPVLLISEDKSAQTEAARRAQHAMGDEHEMLLGMHQLRQLHLYFAYGEERLYATTVAGDAAAAGTTAQSAAFTPQADPVDGLHAGKLNESAIRHLNAREFQLAISDLDRAIALMPQVAGFYANRGIAYAQLGNSQQALQDFGQAIRMDPKLVTAYLGRSEVYARNHQLDMAISDVTKAIQINPLGSSSALTARCRLHAAKKELREARLDCDQAVALGPHQAGPLEGRGLLNLAGGRLNDAIADFDAALELDSHRAWSLMGRGLARQRKGDLAGGKADMAAARAIDPAIENEFSR
jgi:tetratricopeptide (TPR) repeat protein